MTPGHVNSGRYYLGVLTNEAAARREELWSALDLAQPFDILLAATGLILIVAVVVRRLPLWEWVVLVGLAIGSVIAARNGPWLLMFLVAPAAASVSQLGPGGALTKGRSTTYPRWALAALPVLLLLATTPLAGRSDSFTQDDAVVDSTLRLARGRTVLAPEPLAEDLAAGGGRVWVSNPIDAFSRADQAAYLDVWTAGPSARSALAAVDVVVAPASSSALALALETGFSERATIGTMVLLERAR